MARAWRVLESVATSEGALELRQRGEADFLIVIDGRVLMTSAARRSEEALATLACAPLAGNAAPRVLIGGLGMGYTLRAALDALPGSARVEVVELSAEVVAWCRGPLAALTRNALGDARVRVVVSDISRHIAESPPGAWDAILLDLYEGPHEATQRPSDPFYGAAAVARARVALAPDGVFAVWSEEPDAAFAARLSAAGFSASIDRSGRGGRSHVVYLARR